MESQLFPWSAFDERCNICGPVCPTLTTLTSPFLTRNPYIGWSGRWLKRELTLMRNHVASDVDYVQLHLFRYGRFGRAARLARKPAGCFVFTGRSSSVCVCVCVCVCLIYPVVVEVTGQLGRRRALVGAFLALTVSPDARNLPTGT